jgi:hypothetical protein
MAVRLVIRSYGSPASDADVAVITNRDTGYRWILRRGSSAVESQTPGMLAEQVEGDQLDVFLSVEEAEALGVADKREAAVVRPPSRQPSLAIGLIVPAGPSP